MRAWLLIFGSVFFLGAQICTYQIANASDQVCIREHCFDVEIVSKSEDMARGLQWRESLKAQDGMLFVFDQNERHGFWMKDTLIPLDIIWMDDKQRVVYVGQDLPSCPKDPCAIYSPDEKSRYVLEINAGLAKNFNIQSGDRVEFRLSHTLPHL